MTTLTLELYMFLKNCSIMRKIYIYILFMVFNNTYSQTGRQAWTAVINQDSIEVKKWLSKKVSVDTSFWQDRTLLHLSVLAEKKQMAKWLLEKGANVNKQDADGMTPLLWAVSKGDIDLVLLLLSYQPNFKLVNHRGESVLHLAAIHKHISLIKLLLKNGADKSIRDKYDLQPIDYAFDPDIRGLLWIENK